MLTTQLYIPEDSKLQGNILLDRPVTLNWCKTGILKLMDIS
jgi:hypothetical protein